MAKAAAAKKPLALFDDPRVTRSDTKYRTITANLLISFCKQRLPANLPDKSRREFCRICDGMRGQTLDNSRIVVLLDDYYSILRQEPECNQIIETLANNMNITNPGPDEVVMFVNFFTKYFLLPSVTVPHDDWIMMVFLVASDIVNAYTLAGHERFACNLIAEASTKVLTPTKGNRFSAEPWLYNGWLYNYDTMMDPKRPHTLLGNKSLLQMNADSVREELNEPLDNTILQGPDVKSTNPRTVLVIPDSVHQAAAESYKYVNRDTGTDNKYSEYLLKPDIKQPLSRDVLYSYVVSRIPTITDIQPQVKEFRNKEIKFNDMSCRRLGITMQEYGNEIAKTKMYEQILIFFNNNYVTSTQSTPYNMALVQHIMPYSEVVLYDRLMLINLLTSDLINELLVQGRPLDAKALFESAMIALSNPSSRSMTIKTGWRPFSGMRTQFLERAHYDLLFNHSIIGGINRNKRITTGTLESRIPYQGLPLLDDPDLPDNHPLAAQIQESGFSYGAGPSSASTSARHVPLDTGNGAGSSSNLTTKRHGDIPESPTAKTPKAEAPTGSVCNSSDDNDCE